MEPVCDFIDTISYCKIIILIFFQHPLIKEMIVQEEKQAMKKTLLMKSETIVDLMRNAVKRRKRKLGKIFLIGILIQILIANQMTL